MSSAAGARRLPADWPGAGGGRGLAEMRGSGHAGARRAPCVLKEHLAAGRHDRERSEESSASCAARAHPDADGQARSNSRPSTSAREKRVRARRDCRCGEKCIGMSTESIPVFSLSARAHDHACGSVQQRIHILCTLGPRPQDRCKDSYILARLVLYTSSMGQGDRRLFARLMIVAGRLVCGWLFCGCGC